MRVGLDLGTATADNAVGHIAFARHFGVQVVRGYDVLDGHLVCGESARLVGANHIHTAQCLDDR